VVLRKVHASLTVRMRGSAGIQLSEKEEKTHEYENVGSPSLVELIGTAACVAASIYDKQSDEYPEEAYQIGIQVQ
jgi:hypothetical protein